MMNTATRLKYFRTLFTITLLLLIACVRAHAQSGCVSGDASSCTPEIDPSLATSGTALIAGLVLLVRGRRKR